MRLWREVFGRDFGAHVEIGNGTSIWAPSSSFVRYQFPFTSVTAICFKTSRMESLLGMSPFTRLGKTFHITSSKLTVPKLRQNSLKYCIK